MVAYTLIQTIEDTVITPKIISNLLARGLLPSVLSKLGPTQQQQLYRHGPGPRCLRPDGVGCSRALLYQQKRGVDQQTAALRAAGVCGTQWLHPQWVRSTRHSRCGVPQANVDLQLQLLVMTEEYDQLTCMYQCFSCGAGVAQPQQTQHVSVVCGCSQSTALQHLTQQTAMAMLPQSGIFSI